jgi:hypothetical protein
VWGADLPKSPVMLNREFKSAQPTATRKSKRGDTRFRNERL